MVLVRFIGDHVVLVRNLLDVYQIGQQYMPRREVRKYDVHL